MSIETREIQRTNLNYHQLPTLTTATPSPGVGTAALIQAEGVDVRWRADGTDPTTTVGMLLPAGETMWYTGDLSKLTFIETAVGGIINMQVFK